MQIPELESFKNFLWLANRGMVIKGKARKKITQMVEDMLVMNGFLRLSSLLTIFDILASTTEYELLASPVLSRILTLNLQTISARSMNIS